MRNVKQFPKSNGLQIEVTMQTMRNSTLDLKSKFKILASGEFIELSPISSMQEKSMLELQAIQESQNEDDLLDLCCDVCKIPKNLPRDIKLACLLHVREISNGSDCLVKFKCPNCKNYSESLILLEDMLDFSLFDSKELVNYKQYKLKPLDQINIQKIHDCGMLEGLEFFENPPKVESLEQIKDLNLSLKARLPKFKSDKTCKCIICQFENLVDVNPKFVLNSMSTHSLNSMYQAYHKLVINGFTKGDVDGMLPFEREVHLGLIDKAEQNLQQQKQQNQQNTQNQQNHTKQRK